MFPSKPTCILLLAMVAILCFLSMMLAINQLSENSILNSFGYRSSIPTKKYDFNHFNDSTSKTIKSLSLVQQRVRLPPKCENSTHKMLNIVPADHNWAPYYFRCIFEQNVKGNGVVGGGFFSKELGYLHVWKAGGTTMRLGLLRLLKSNKLISLTPYNISKSQPYDNPDLSHLPISQFLNFIDDKTMMFSFVRDPIDKFLSSFYEANRRSNFTKYNRKTGIESMRAWLKDMSPSLVRPWPNFINAHAKPNVLFLRKVIPFQFIGDLYHLKQDIAQILNSFLVDDALLNNASLLINTMFLQGRDRRNNNYATKQTKKFNIDRAELSDNDIENICKIYWIDYICFPFDIPQQCNISYLLEQHYNKHVHYDSCY